MSNGLSQVLERLDGAAAALAERQQVAEVLQQELQAGREALDAMRTEALTLTAAEVQTHSEAMVRWRWIQERYDLDGLLDRIDAWPARLAELEAASEGLQRERTAAQKALADREAEALAEVCAEVVEATGKPAYTNEAGRKAEAATRLAADPGAAHLREQIAGLDYDVARVRVDYDEARRSYRNAEGRRNVLGDMFRALSPR